LSQTPVQWPWVGRETCAYCHGQDRRSDDGNAETIDIDYDLTTHRVAAVTTSEGAELVPTYDSAGRVTHLEGPYWSGNPAGPDVELAYTYNGPLVTSEQWIGDTAGTVSWAFNNRGLVSSQQVNGTSAAAYTYDEDDLVLTAGSVTLGRSATSGRVQTVTLSTISQTLSYDSFGDVSGSVYAETSGPTEVYEYALERDQLGRIIEETNTVAGGTPEVWSYEYDARGRLERVELDSVLYAEYGYDPNGNRVSVTTTGGTTYASYDEQDRILDVGAVTYTHGANGEITGKSDGTSYEYDALGNLLEVTLPNTTKIRYAYDGRGRPVARYVDGVYDKGWLWGSQLEPIAEVDELGVVVARYVYGSRAHVPDYMVKGGVTYRLITDYRGSVVAVVNASNGMVVQELEYGPWGEVLSDTAPGFQSFGYAGGIWDGDTGLVLFGARWYDAGLGRWMRKDPILFDGGQANLYMYVMNQPTNHIDPTGLKVYRCTTPLVSWGPGFFSALRHQWIKTETKQFGLFRCEGSRPLSDWLNSFPFDSRPACIRDQAGWFDDHPLTVCYEIDGADEECVNSRFHGEQIFWTEKYSFSDNCGDYVDNVLSECVPDGVGPAGGQVAIVSRSHAGFRRFLLADPQ
jgi:RHS repeat-associated protein